MYKIGIIGDRDSVLGFMALGFAVHEAPDAEQAGVILHELVKSGEYGAIFLVEHYAKELEEELAVVRELPLPAVTVIPGRQGSTGYGTANMKHAVERAVGADIIFKENR
ncbi:MAG: V-type ATP synthase subunit F [Clostridia bacterium]|nr:V-type ATP synthase subunit F [Clostridia bacterium]